MFEVYDRASRNVLGFFETQAAALAFVAAHVHDHDVDRLSLDSVAGTSFQTVALGPQIRALLAANELIPRTSAAGIVLEGGPGRRVFAAVGDTFRVVLMRPTEHALSTGGQISIGSSSVEVRLEPAAVQSEAPTTALVGTGWT